MKTSQFLLLAVAAFRLAEARGGQGGQGGNAGNTAATSSAATAAATTANTGSTSTSTTGSNGGGTNLALLQSNVQSGSNQIGANNAEAGQSPSATDAANFINFCTGKTLTNGDQVTAGSCNGVVMGDIPASSNMVSTIITNPQTGQDLTPNTQFTVNVQVANLVAGVFTDPLSTYYSAPQGLQNGNVVGHTHITIQDIGSINPSTPPSASTFAFFKGIDDNGNGQGALSAVVAGGLPAGTYRVCTMSSAANHQPVLMPVAQRGAQDDCTKFTVGQGNGASSPTNAGNTASSGSTGNGGSSGTGGAAASSGTACVAGSSGSTTTSSFTSGSAAGNTTTSTTTTTTGTGNTGNTGGTGNTNGQGGRTGRGGRHRFMARNFIA